MEVPMGAEGEFSASWQSLRDAAKRAAMKGREAVPPERVAAARERFRSSVAKLQGVGAGEETQYVGAVAGIFVSYRRKDGSGYVRALRGPLSERFGRESVFVDADAIEAGGNFKERIHQALNNSAVLVAVIGTEWIAATDDAGRSRLHDDDDYVRLEIATALKSNMVVLPVLVDGAQMPSANELPPDLALLATRQAIELSNVEWDASLEHLLSTIAERVRDQKGSTQLILKTGTNAWQWRGVMNVSSEQTSEAVRHALEAIAPKSIQSPSRNAFAVTKGIPAHAGCIILGQWRPSGPGRTAVTVSVRAVGASATDGLAAWVLPVVAPLLKSYLRVVVENLHNSGLVVH
jgi:hypothetical protein